MFPFDPLVKVNFTIWELEEPCRRDPPGVSQSPSFTERCRTHRQKHSSQPPPGFLQELIPSPAWHRIKEVTPTQIFPLPKEAKAERFLQVGCSCLILHSLGHPPASEPLPPPLYLNAIPPHTQTPDLPLELLARLKDSRTYLCF